MYSDITVENIDTKLSKYKEVTTHSLADDVYRYKEMTGAASDNDTPVEVLEKILEYGDLKLQLLVAKNPSISYDMMKRLLEFDNDYINDRLSLNHSVPLDILTKLFESETETVLVALASNVEIPVEILSKLVRMESKAILFAAVGNPNILAEDLRIVSKNEDSSIRREVAWRFNTPVDVLRELSKDRDQGVLENVVFYNENITLDILAYSLFSKYDNIRMEVCESELLRSHLDVFVVSDVFVEQSVPCEIFEKYDVSEYLGVAELLLCAADNDMCFSVESFGEAFAAVVECCMIPYVAVGIFGIPLR